MKKINKLIIIFTIFVICSCSLDVKQDNLFTDPYAIADEDSARDFMSSLYDNYPQTQYSLSVLSDDFMPTININKDGNERNFYGWIAKDLLLFSDGLWLDYYNCVALSNVLIERIDKLVTNENLALKSIKGEALLLKSMCYFDLLRLFAPTPDVTKDQDGIIFRDNLDITFPARESIQTSVHKIDSMLLLAESMMLDYSPKQQYWLSKDVLYYKIAELAQYQGNYQKVKTYTSDLLVKYPLALLNLENYENLWDDKSSSKERIFGFANNDIFYSEMQYNDTTSVYSINTNIKCEENDYRNLLLTQDNTFKDYNGNITKLKVIGKYHLMNIEGVSINFINSITVERLVLMHLEALIHTDDVSAFSFFNDYLRRRGLNQITVNLNKNQLLEKLMKIRQLAFVGEGDRYFDLKRIRPSEFFRYDYKHNVASKILSEDYRWTFAIPASEYRHNPNATQNDGWPRVTEDSYL